MFNRPDPSAWRIGAMALVQDILRPIRQRLAVTASFWPRRRPFYTRIHPEPAAPVLTPRQAPEAVAGLLWAAQMRHLLWHETGLPAPCTPDLTWHYADLHPDALLADLIIRPAVSAQLQMMTPTRMRPMRVSAVVDKVLSKEPWFGDMPFAYGYQRALQPKRMRVNLPTETAIPAMVAPRAAVLTKAAAGKAKDAQSLGKLPLHPLRASNANALPLVRTHPPRRALRRRRTGLR